MKRVFHRTIVLALAFGCGFGTHWMFGSQLPGTKSEVTPMPVGNYEKTLSPDFRSKYDLSNLNGIDKVIYQGRGSVLVRLNPELVSQLPPAVFQTLQLECSFTNKEGDSFRPVTWQPSVEWAGKELLVLSDVKDFDQLIVSARLGDEVVGERQLRP
jgi:hypothetical protein